LENDRLPKVKGGEVVKRQLQPWTQKKKGQGMLGKGVVGRKLEGGDRGRGLKILRIILDARRKPLFEWLLRGPGWKVFYGEGFLVQKNPEIGEKVVLYEGGRILSRLAWRSLSLGGNDQGIQKNPGLGRERDVLLILPESLWRTRARGSAR